MDIFSPPSTIPVTGANINKLEDVIKGYNTRLESAKQIPFRLKQKHDREFKLYKKHNDGIIQTIINLLIQSKKNDCVDNSKIDSLFKQLKLP